MSTLTELRACVDALIEHYMDMDVKIDESFAFKLDALDQLVDRLAASKEVKPDDAICEHEWQSITEPHKCCEKCGDVRRDWDASKEAVTLSEQTNKRLDRDEQ